MSVESGVLLSFLEKINQKLVFSQLAVVLSFSKLGVV